MAKNMAPEWFTSDTEKTAEMLVFTFTMIHPP